MVSNSAAKPVLVANRITMIFNEGQASQVRTLQELSFELADREVLGLVGPTGCGKTTLFNIIAGLLEPSRGSVHVKGKLVQGATGHVGYMLQKDLLLPWRSVIDNVVLGLEVRRADPRQARAIGMKLIEAYGLKGFENAKPATLSGGMRQRVAFMRTLAFDPEVILLDEPFSALDFQTRLVLQAEVMRIIRERSKSVILVTHDIGEAITMADRIIVLSHRPASIRSIHKIDLSIGERDPIRIRKNPLFNEYFETIWSELDVKRS
jgi:NitT/TauT family transport system ATP-binding protein